METIAVAGASGFVGKALVPALRDSYKIISLTRGSVSLHRYEDPSVEWRKCDLFSLEQSTKALEGVDRAIYLVHSMLPAAHLTQAQFEDLDLLVADNFARAAAACGVKQIVYLGGIIPPDEELSLHLESRLEVERALGSYGVPVTALRAAMIFGPTGSSMEVVIRLVKRLPIMICPSWTATKSNPVYIGDVVKAIEHVLKSKEHYDKIYDLGGKTRLSYREMMHKVGLFLKRPPKIYGVPVLTPQLSRLWVSTVTGAPKNLILPLVESLKHDMVPCPEQNLEIPEHQPLGFDEILEQSLEEETGEFLEQPRAFQLPPDEKSYHAVRSVQRLIAPESFTANDVAEHYYTWLPKFLSPVFRILEEGPKRSFFVRPLPTPILVIEKDEDGATTDNVTYNIKGGLLLEPNSGGRLVFRKISSAGVFIVALQDYHPRLPWYIYVLTQAKVHLWVMMRFKKYLKSLRKL